MVHLKRYYNVVILSIFNETIVIQFLKKKRKKLKTPIFHIVKLLHLSWWLINLYSTVVNCSYKHISESCYYLQ